MQDNSTGSTDSYDSAVQANSPPQRSRGEAIRSQFPLIGL